MPAVSVLMSVYNGADYLPPALDSLLDQTFEDFELVVVDDASTDETPGILDEYEERDDRIFVMRNSENLRQAGARNRGLSLCTAPFVAIADADDIYEKDRLQCQVDFMNENPEVGVLSSNVHRVDQDGKNLRRSNLPLRHEAIRLQMNYTFPLRHPATMFRRDLLLEAGGYNEEAAPVEDVELCGRLIRHTQFANLEEPLVRWRRHDASSFVTRGQAGRRIALYTRQRMLREYTGETFSLEQVEALHTLLKLRSVCHFQAVVEEGLEIAKTLRDELRRRGLGDLRREFEEELFGAICSQSVKHGASDRSFGWYLLREAVRISPRQVGRIRGLKRIAAMIRG